MDPNSIVGTPQEREVWLAPDWSVYRPITQKQPSGYMRVSVREVRYADGRVVTQVLDENHQPITTQVINEPPDDDQARRFKDAQRTAQTQIDQAERRVTRKYQGTDPATGQPAIVTEYESGPPSYDSSTTASTPSPTQQNEAALNNERSWHEQQGHGRVTHAEWRTIEDRQRKEAADRQPTQERGAVTGYPGWTAVTQIDAQGNKVTVYIDPQQQAHTSLPAKPEAAPAPTTRAVRGGDGKDYLQTITFDASGQPIKITNIGPDKKEVAEIPGQAEDKGTVVTRNDKQYTVRPGKDTAGNPTVEVYDAQGTRQSGLPSEQKPGATRYNSDTGEYDEVTTDANGRTVVRSVPREGGPPAAQPGPAMPSFIVGAASQALTGYHQALAADPTLSPAQRERRFTEAMQTATMAVNEANVAQSDLNSTRSYNYNVASTKLNYYQQGLGQALNFVARFNDKLPPNSPLGGQALRALLGIQMIQMNASGINQLNPGGVPTQPRYPAPPGATGTGPGATRPATPAGAGASAAAPAGVPSPAMPTPAELNDPAALERKRQEILAHPAFRPPPPVEGQAPAANGAAPPPPAPTPGPAGVAPIPVAPPAGPTPTGPTPISTAPPPPPLTSPMQAPGNGPVLRVKDRWGNEYHVTQQQLDNRPGGSADMTVLGPLGAPQSMAPPPGPSPTAAVAPSPPQEDFAVLKQMRPPEPPAPVVPPVEVPPPPPVPVEPPTPALLRMKAMTTPPWRLSPIEIQQMQSLGIPDDMIFQARPQPLGSFG